MNGNADGERLHGKFEQICFLSWDKGREEERNGKILFGGCIIVERALTLVTVRLNDSFARGSLKLRRKQPRSVFHDLR